MFIIAKIQLIRAPRVLELLGQLLQGLISPSHLCKVLRLLLLLRQPVLLLILGLRHRLLQNLIRHCLLRLLLPSGLLLGHIMAILVLLLVTHIILLARHVIPAQLLPEQPPLHLLHHILLEVQRVEQHHVLVRVQIVAGDIHEVLPVVQDDALRLR